MTQLDSDPTPPRMPDTPPDATSLQGRLAQAELIAHACIEDLHSARAALRDALNDQKNLLAQRETLAADVERLSTFERDIVRMRSEQRDLKEKLVRQGDQLRLLQSQAADHAEMRLGAEVKMRNLATELAGVHASTSWRITRPLRAIRRPLRALRILFAHLRFGGN